MTFTIKNLIEDLEEMQEGCIEFYALKGETKYVTKNGIKELDMAIEKLKEIKNVNE